jgi:FkbM family methyltransferase
MCDDAMSNQIHQTKMYDPVTSTLVEHALSSAPDMSRVFVEAGAGTGYFSMLAASWGTDVVAFEPNATARQLLQYNAGLHKDGRVRVVPYALGAQTTLAAAASKQNTTDSSSSSSNVTGASSQMGPSPAVDASNANSSSSSNSTSSNEAKKWGVDVLRLSDALNGDAEVTVLLLNVPTMDGVSVPDFVAAAEGAYDMLKRVKVRRVMEQTEVTALLLTVTILE